MIRTKTKKVPYETIKKGDYFKYKNMLCQRTDWAWGYTKVKTGDTFYPIFAMGSWYVTPVKVKITEVK